MTELQKIRRVIYFKGFGITYQRKTYTAAAYANPTFYNSNLAKLKTEINQYLKS